MYVYVIILYVPLYCYKYCSLHRNDHTNKTARPLVRSGKLTLFRLSQYYSGWPYEKPQCCSFFTFCGFETFFYSIIEFRIFIGILMEIGVSFFIISKIKPIVIRYYLLIISIYCYTLLVIVTSKRWLIPNHKHIIIVINIINHIRYYHIVN